MVAADPNYSEPMIAWGDTEEVDVDSSRVTKFKQVGGASCLLGSSSHVYLVFEEVTSGSEWGVLLRSPTHSNASSPMHDGKFLFKNM